MLIDESRLLAGDAVDVELGAPRDAAGLSREEGGAAEVIADDSEAAAALEFGEGCEGAGFEDPSREGAGRAVGVANALVDEVVTVPEIFGNPAIEGLGGAAPERIVREGEAPPAPRCARLFPPMRSSLRARLRRVLAAGRGGDLLVRAWTLCWL
ncbi:MAG: hypothetical protein U0271_16095 [Polyangiaceae bacterium]